MTHQQLKNKIAELDEWLYNNPNHPNRETIATDKRGFERDLAEKERLTTNRK